MSGAAVFVVAILFLAIAIGSGLVLYTLVRSEHDDRDVMDRNAAERAARRDSGQEHDE